MKRLLIALAFVLLWAGNACAQVTFDADANGSSGYKVTGATSPTDFPTFMTVGTGLNRALVVGVSTAGTITSVAVTWDQGGTNQAMTMLTNGVTTDGQTSWLFGLVAPTSGTLTLRVAWTGAPTEIAVGGVAWTGVNQTGGTTSFPNAHTDTGNSVTASVTVTSATNHATQSVIATGQSFALTSVSATKYYLQSGSINDESGGSRAAGSASNVMTGTSTGAQSWSASGTDIAPVGGGTTCGARLLTRVGC